jgi:hypothetical protein
VISREIVQKTIRCEGPERIAMSLPEPYPHDFVWGSLSPDPHWKPSRTFAPDKGAMWEDEWGNVWARLDDFSKGLVVEGALKDWSDLEAYRFPTWDDPARYEAARETFEKEPDRFRMGGLNHFPFDAMRYLRRMDVFLEDLAAHTEEVRQLADMVVPLLARCIENWAAAGADGVMFGEDWGTQDRLLISPRMWRDVFKPDYAKLCDVARRNGMSVWMHSCGYIWDIIPDLVECGVSVLQLDQPGLFGVDRLAENFGGKVTFWCPVDIQQVLPTGDEEKIEASARELVEKLGAFGGGFIAGYYGDNNSIGVRPEWQDVACRAFVKYGQRDASAV